MKIIFDTGKKQYALQSDGASFELAEKTMVTDKATQETTEKWVPFKWFGSLPLALETIALLKVKHSDVSSLKELKALLTKIHKDLIKEFKI